MPTPNQKKWYAKLKECGKEHKRSKSTPSRSNSVTSNSSTQPSRRIEPQRIMPQKITPMSINGSQTVTSSMPEFRGYITFNSAVDRLEQQAKEMDRKNTKILF